MSDVTFAFEPLRISGATKGSRESLGATPERVTWDWWVPKRESGATMHVPTSEYRLTAARIRELSQEDKVDEAGAVTRPTAQALRRTMEFVRRAGELLGDDFPRGSASVAYDGGIRVTWVRGRREVRLICGGHDASRTYIYCDPEETLDPVVSAERLASYLAILANES